MMEIPLAFICTLPDRSAATSTRVRKNTARMSPHLFLPVDGLLAGQRIQLPALGNLALNLINVRLQVVGILRVSAQIAACWMRRVYLLGRGLLRGGQDGVAQRALHGAALAEHAIVLKARGKTRDSLLDDGVLLGDEIIVATRANASADGSRYVERGRRTKDRSGGGL